MKNTRSLKIIIAVLAACFVIAIFVGFLSARKDTADMRPIGVYDSGMGGLIVLETLIEEFPNEDFIFIADNANVPYGTKESYQVEGYNLVLSDYLMDQDVKAICIACNTADDQNGSL